MRRSTFAFCDIDMIIQKFERDRFRNTLKMGLIQLSTFEIVTTIILIRLVFGPN